MLASSFVKWIKRYLRPKPVCFSIVLLTAVVIGSGLSYLQITYTKAASNDQDYTVILPPGISLNTIAKILFKNHVIDCPQSFIWNARLRGFYRFIQAGEYHFPKQRTLKSILALLISGKTVVHKFTLVEGQTTKEMLIHLQASNHFVGDLVDWPEEGSLWPDTYHYTHGTDRRLFVKKMQQSMQKHLETLWQQRNPRVMLTSSKQALILASIVEKETSLISEKAHVAGLFYNRLRIGMKLQSDPTVSYGLYLLKNRPLNQALSRAELTISTPHNTYIHAGLPPTPICNPSLTSLEAVLHPLDTSDFYFITDGTGGHIFSSNYRDHQRYHHALRQRRAQLEKNK